MQITSSEYIKKQLALGETIHEHNGVWWIKSSHFVCKPVNPYQIIERDMARPKYIKSFLGYSHLVRDKKTANSYWPKFILTNDKIRNFGFDCISQKRRNIVRKGLKLTEIRKIENIYPLINNIKDVCISTAVRTGRGYPPNYYIQNYEKWKSYICKMFNIGLGEWWGAFYENLLIAYIYVYQIDDTMIIAAAKSHTDYLDKCPNDALIFTFLNHCKQTVECKRIEYGSWSEDNESLNSFKQRFGFERMDLPVYAKYNHFIALAKKLIKRKK
ncbi:hypothetical protein C4544_04270 [candidate division WS5 bacterium]|uniref:Uncharacterized protein n=1 Tax=candidate division WS5 bacterium TaxID=2093353 RepID=A0A419DCS2_9BACT|nr:MAG: hypothetical protein C4544_04270 [candidate division WS5 bacterium]